MEDVRKISRITIKDSSVIIRLEDGKRIAIIGRDGVFCEVMNANKRPSQMKGVALEKLFIERNISSVSFGGDTVVGGVERLDINHPDSDNFMGINFKVATSLENASDKETFIEIIEE